MAGNWTVLIEFLRDQLAEQDRVTLTLDEIVTMTNTEDRSIRTQGAWRYAQRGGASHRRFADAGFAFEYEPIGRGLTVETVTFWRR